MLASAASFIVHIAQTLQHAAGAIPPIPTEEEPGFKFTVSLGQILQIVGFVGTVTIVWSKYAVRSALHERDMKDMRRDVDDVKKRLDRFEDMLRQLPQVLAITHRNERMNRAILGHLRAKDVPVAEDAEEEPDLKEDVTHALEKLSQLGESK